MTALDESEFSLKRDGIFVVKPTGIPKLTPVAVKLTKLFICAIIPNPDGPKNIAYSLPLIRVVTKVTTIASDSFEVILINFKIFQFLLSETNIQNYYTIWKIILIEFTS